MKGFRLKSDNNTICAGLETGCVSVLITSKENLCSLSLSGIDSANLSYRWFEKDLCIGDSFHITFEEMCESDVSEASLDDRFKAEPNYELLLERYYKLKQELIDEGLIRI